MTARPWTAGEKAALDQMMAEAGETLDRLLSKVREEIAEHGEPQGLTNTALALTKGRTPDQNASLLLAALYRLAQGAQGSGRPEDPAPFNGLPGADGNEY